MGDLAAQAEAAMLAMKGKDNAAIQEAQTFLKAFLKKAASAAILFTLLQSAEAAYVRQLSGVFLRRKIMRLWMRLDKEQQDALKGALLARMGEETSRGARKAVVMLVAVLSKVLLPAGEWPELVGAMLSCCTHEAEDMRELGMVLLGEIAVRLRDRVTPALPVFQSALAAGLEDAAPRVRAATMRALGCVLVNLDLKPKRDADAVAACRDLYGRMMALAYDSMSGANEALLTEVLDVVSTLVETHSPIAQPHVQATGHFLIAAMACGELENSTRDAASQSIFTLLESKPRTFLNKGLLEEVGAAPRVGGVGPRGRGGAESLGSPPSTLTPPPVPPCPPADHAAAV
jgi:hypothetical protein